MKKLLPVIAVLLFPFSFFLFPSPTHAAFKISLPINNLNLVGYWTFDTQDMTPNVRDRSGNNNHGNLLGQVSTTTVDGKVRQGLSFDGTDDRVTTSVNIAAGDKTLSAWIYPTSVSEASNQIFSGMTLNWWLSLTNDQLDFHPRDNSDNLSITRLVPNRWYYVTGSCNSTTQKVSLYINGVLDVQFSNLCLDSTDQPYAIGSYAGTVAQNFHGIIDEARIYTRALTDAEVKNLYLLGVPSHLNASKNTSMTSGLVGIYSFDGADLISNVTDRSGNGNNGRLIGFTSTTTVPGKMGQALSFNGSNSWTSNILWSASDTSWTFATWFKTTSDSQGFLTNYDGNANLGFNTDNGGFGSCGARDSSGNSISVTTHNRYHDGVWHHLACVLNGTTISIYIDGVFDDSATNGSVNGNYASGGTRLASSNLTASIDDQRVYKRALSAAEIKQLYNLAVASHANASQNTKSTNGLMGLWSFDGPDMINNVTDRSGNGNNGNLANFTSTTTVPGRIGQALQFDGVNDYVKTVSTVPLLGSNLSVSAWVRPDAGNTAYNRIAETYYSEGFALVANSDGTMYSFVVNTPVDTCIGGTLTVGKWTHLVGTFDGTNRRLYVDNVLVCTVGSTAPTVNHPLYIGAFRDDLTSYNWHGSMDDVRIYNRALSATEIQQLYKLGR